MQFCFCCRRLSDEYETEKEFRKMEIERTRNSSQFIEKKLEGHIEYGEYINYTTNFLYEFVCEKCYSMMKTGNEKFLKYIVGDKYICEAYKLVGRVPRKYEKGIK